jgi:hypothetical protein
MADITHAGPRLQAMNDALEAERQITHWRLEAEVHRQRAAAAVAEIARLRLTDEERSAIAYAELALRCETHPVCERHTATLRSLLKRLEVRS